MQRKSKKSSSLSWKDIKNAIIFRASDYSFFRQITAPDCPHCNNKLFFINDYCINCNISWQVQNI